MDNKLQEALWQRAEVELKRQEAYDRMIDNINQGVEEVNADKLGPQFAKACCKDIAGEVIRMLTPGPIANAGITVDQLVTRVVTFSYETDYDPLVNGSEYQKTIYETILPNTRNGSTYHQINNIIQENEAHMQKLFTKSDVNGRKVYDDNGMMKKGKEEYAAGIRRDNDGILVDEYTGEDPGYRTNQNGDQVSRAQVDHVQAAATAKYNSKYMGEQGVDRMKKFYNSEDNFGMMTDVANGSKGDVKVYKRDGKVLSKGEVSKLSQDEKNDYDVTHKATPDEYANAVAERWETSNSKERLMEAGYLDENGKVKPEVRKQLEKNIKHSQNRESMEILKGLTDDDGKAIKAISEDAAKATKKAIGKIITGQIIYYTLPPLVYEVREGINNGQDEDSILDRIKKSSKRILAYVTSKLQEILGNIMSEGMKSFIRSFFDILISMLKSTVKKVMRMIKVFAVSVVDVVKITCDSTRTAAEKAEAVTSLLSVAITGVLIEIVFEYIEKVTGIPEIFIAPLQMIVTIMASNFIMLGLKKIDLFGVRGQINKATVLSILEEERQLYHQTYAELAQRADTNIQQLISTVQQECVEFTRSINEMDMFKQEARPALQGISDAFGMNIDFDGEWK